MNVDWQHRASAPPDAVLREFPGAAAIFDLPTVTRKLVAAGALEPRMARAEVSIANVWYIAGRALHVVYACAGAGAAGPRIMTVEFGRAGAASQAAGQAASPTTSRAAEGALSGLLPDALPGVFPLPEWHAVVRVFPADPALPELAGLLDGDVIAARLSGALGADLRPAAMRWSLLSYLPGERAALHLSWPAAAIGVVAKTGAAPNPAALAALWRDPRRRFGMAEPLLTAPELPVRCERFVEGERIEALAARRAASAWTRRELLKPVMDGLAALHAMPLAGLAPQAPADLLLRVRRKVLPRLVVALPDLAPRAAALVDALAAEPPEGPLRLLHGDLHTANLLLDGDRRAVFVDLDSLCLGDPALDLAQLGTRLALGEARGDGDTALLAAAAELPALYAAAGGAAPGARTYAWYVALLLVGRQIKTCVRHLAPGLQTLACRLLDAAEAVWRQGEVLPDPRRHSSCSRAGLSASLTTLSDSAGAHSSMNLNAKPRK